MTPSSRFAASAYAAAFCIAFMACTRTPARKDSPPPNVVLVVIDTLRADHVGCYGYESAGTARLDALARTGVRFANARTASSWTGASVASILTGMYPSAHGLEQSASVLSARHETLAKLLGAAGYDTAAFSANIAYVTPAAGLAQGFDRFEVVHMAVEAGDPAYDVVPAKPGSTAMVKPATADRLTDAVLAWLAERANTTRPFFLYVHYFDPHGPYSPPAELARRFGVPADTAVTVAAQQYILFHHLPPTGVQREHLLGLYDGEIAFTDEHMARLLDVVAAHGKALIVVTSDHGEEFGEHGRMQHGHSLWEQQLRVPLVMAGPGIPPGAVVESPVSLVDLLPSIADLVRVPVPPQARGRSLVPLLRGEPPAERVFFADLAVPFAAHRTAVFGDPWKLLIASDGSPLLFDVQNDPGELTNVGDRQPDRTGPFLAAARAHAETGHSVRGDVPAVERELTAEERAKLRALGYAE